MKKTLLICDICGKRMSTLQYGDKIDLHVSAPGIVWDICYECKADLNRWIDARRTKIKQKEESEE